MLQQFNIILRDRILIHCGIHGWCNDLWCTACKNGSCQHIIGETMRKLCHDISSCRCDHDNVCKLGKCNVLYFKFKISVKCICDTFMSCQSLKSNWIDKIGGVLSHDDMNVSVCFYQKTCKCCNFIRSNTSGHAKQDMFSF